jgi:dCTP diphosphatase
MVFYYAHFEKNYQNLALNTNRIKEIMEKLISNLRNFAKERNWLEYHSPKNLAMALSVETAELVEIFQWMEAKDSRQVDTVTKKHIAEEVGDVMIYLTMLADKFDLDPLNCAKDKMELNAIKYPTDK